MTVKLHASKPQELCCNLQMTSPIRWGTNKQGRFLSGPPTTSCKTSSSWPRSAALLQPLATTLLLGRCWIHWNDHPESLSSGATEGKKTGRHGFCPRCSFRAPSRNQSKVPSSQGWNWDKVEVTYCVWRQRTSNRIQLGIVSLPRPQSRDWLSW